MGIFNKNTGRHFKKTNFEQQYEIARKKQSSGDSCCTRGPAGEHAKNCRKNPINRCFQCLMHKDECKCGKITATTIHMMIKKILDDSPDLRSHCKARSILVAAYANGYKGKRLTKWLKYFNKYFKDLEEKKIG